MFILAMRCIQLQKQLAAVSPTTTCHHLFRWLCGKEYHKDEIYGSNTYNAVLDYQSKNNLAADSLLLAGRWNSHEQANIPAANGRWKQ